MRWPQSLLTLLLLLGCGPQERLSITVVPDGSSVEFDGIMLDARHAGLEGPMIIGLPLPDGAPTEDLGVALFAPAGAGLHGNTPAQWLTRGASYLPSIDRVAFANSFFPSDGSFIFAVVSGVASGIPATDGSEQIQVASTDHLTRGSVPPHSI